MSGETLAVLLAAAVGLALAMHLERDRRATLGLVSTGFLGLGTQAAQVYPASIGYSAYNSVPVATVPSSPSTWALIL